MFFKIIKNVKQKLKHIIYIFNLFLCLVLTQMHYVLL
jgi:hypothetical protein